MRALVPAAFLCIVVSVACANEDSGDAVLGSSAALANTDRQFVPGNVRGQPMLLDPERGFVPGNVRGQPMLVADSVPADDCAEEIEALLDSSKITAAQGAWLRELLAAVDPDDRQASCELVASSLQELE